MASDAKAERLQNLPLFNGADKDAIEHLAAAADEVTVEAGHTLISQGRHHQEMYVLESGAAVVEIDGRQVAEVVAGEFVGELGYFTKAPASATVRTAAESKLLVIPYNRFEQILDDNPRMVRAIVAELAERLQAADHQLKTMKA
ncbi:MAG: cyclic nucleotide-binding domain-containing protein [Acidimicrobiia bacterium]|nr:cyclic nucleotide-binding domain-containing protein [Acidimicrobiia bacterium]